MTTAGTTSFRLLRETDKGRNLQVTQVAGKDHTDSLLLVESGRTNAFVLDDILLAGRSRTRATRRISRSSARACAPGTSR